MVRLTKLIEQGVRKSELDFLEDDVLEAPSKASRPIKLPKVKKAKDYQLFSGQDNYHIRMLDDLYHQLISIAEHSIVDCLEGRDVDLDSIESNISGIAGAFVENSYSGLLLMLYGEAEGDYLAQHLVNNTILSVGFGRYLGLSHEQLHLLGKIAFFHDLGMAHFSSIYNKPRHLKQSEFIEIQKHPEKTLDYIGAIFSEAEDEILISIHERVSAQGYPIGKKGKGISPYAKMIAICDVYDALTHKRPFRGAYAPFEAMKIIIRMKADLLDEELVKAFMEYMAVYPVGSLVYLTTNEIAIVLRSNSDAPTRPLVQILVNSKNVIEHRFQTINLAKNELLYVRGPVEQLKEKEIFYLLNMHAEGTEGYEGRS